MNKKRPAEIGLRDDELAIRWQDGSDSRYALEAFRRNCPCALCRALREEPGVRTPPAPGPLELPMLNDTAASATSQASGWALVGRYGLRLTWADGHDHGIYTFEYLREQG